MVKFTNEIKAYIDTRFFVKDKKGNYLRNEKGSPIVKPHAYFSENSAIDCLLSIVDVDNTPRMYGDTPRHTRSFRDTKIDSQTTKILTALLFTKEGELLKKDEIRRRIGTTGQLTEMIPEMCNTKLIVKFKEGYSISPTGIALLRIIIGGKGLVSPAFAISTAEKAFKDPEAMSRLIKALQCLFTDELFFKIFGKHHSAYMLSIMKNFKQKKEEISYIVSNDNPKQKNVGTCLLTHNISITDFVEKSIKCALRVNEYEALLRNEAIITVKALKNVVFGNVKMLKGDEVFFSRKNGDWVITSKENPKLRAAVDAFLNLNETERAQFTYYIKNKI